MLTDEERALAREAVEAYDAVLQARPATSHAGIAEATTRIVRIRDSLIARRRAGQRTDDVLARVNALVGAAYSAQFPIAGVRWERIETTRNALEDLSRSPGGS